jgi:hypothetical protein
MLIQVYRSFVHALLVIARGGQTSDQRVLDFKLHLRKFITQFVLQCDGEQGDSELSYCEA